VEGDDVYCRQAGTWEHQGMLQTGRSAVINYLLDYQAWRVVSSGMLGPDASSWIN